jgi:hypothetical protein
MVLDILLQHRRDKAAARRFFRRLLKETGSVPRVIVTDKLRSYGAAHREVRPSVKHRSHKGLNNQAENSHQPTRQREPAMKVQDTVRAHPAQQFHRQVGQQERQPDHVVAGVEDNEDRQAAVLQCLAARRRSTTSRSCAAVTAVSSSPGPSRTASSSAHQEVRPGSRAATIEYGQPGIICAEPLPRP